MPDGTFKYIRRNSASLLAYYGSDQGTVNSANSLPRTNSGLNMKVIRVERRGNEKRGYVNYLVLGGSVRHEVDVDNAVKFGEISVPDEFKPKEKPVASTISTADELKKFKELLDSGAITQEEYDGQKKKLLGL